MKKRLSIVLGLLALAFPLFAQMHIPPVFKDTSGIRPDKMTRAYITPKRIVWVSNPTSVKDAFHLLEPNTGQADLENKNMCLLTSQKGDTASIILDFGREIHGGLKLVFSQCSKGETPLMRIRFGESVSETCSELKSITGNPNGATNDHAIRDFKTVVPFWGQIELGSTGFRFVRIDLLSEDISIFMKEATAIFRFKDVPYLGSFKCDDENLNEIWNVGAYTVHLNMQEYIWDGIKRDRLIWLGDMHPETSTISRVFGNDDSFYASLDLACEQWPLPNWLNGMSAYSLWYLIIQHDWYLHNGDKTYLNNHAAYITGLIDQIDGLVDADGSEHLAAARFLDWPSSPNKEGVEAGYRALLCWAMDDGAKLCRLLGDESHEKKCHDITARLKKKILPPNDLKQAAALMAIAGLMTPEEAATKYILPRGPKGFSTFYGYYMLQALAMAGKYDEAMDIIKAFWGGMLKLGATTFWEDFNLDWTENAARIDDFVPAGKKDIHGDFGAYCYPGFRHSFCHGWASGPTAWMSEHILGFQPLEAGCRKLSIKPHLGHLKWAEGTLPTPYGTVYVKHTKDAAGKVHTTVKAPKDIKIVKQ
ncbi:MAG: alpha-L-rhamnosidase [Bacteroidaceae bacterium]|nr:alpha-L-rhamnosidase [Bacteroidaceae bacterium]